MDTNFTLSSITQADVDAARATLITLIQAVPEYSNLDFSSGTVLNDLLIRPQSELWALEELRMQFVQQMKSLQSMLDSGQDIPVDAINDILSNFNLKIKTTSKATGSVIVKVTNDSDVSIPVNYTFTDPTGLIFETTQAYVFSRQPTTGQLPMYVGTDNIYYFIVPLTAVDYGTQYMLKQATALTPMASIYSMVSAEAYTNFTGAATTDNLQAVIDQLPAAISHKSLESRKSIEGILTSPDFGNFTNINAMSVVGAGDKCQLRDKHNYVGASMFGRVDIYPRTFEGPTIVTLEKIGKRIAPNTFEITISDTDAPGYYAIKSVTEAESVINPLFSFNTLVAIGSYAFVDTRSTVNLLNTYHDISSSNAIVETAYTKYQQGKIVVYNVMTVPADDHPFKVELYCAPDIAAIQDYVDDSSIKNVKADYLVRAPLMCLVGLRLTLDIPLASTMTVDSYKTILSNYINRVSFTEKLTQGEIVGLLMNNGVRYVDLTGDATYGFRMEGRIRAADGSTIVLYGPDLIISNVENEKLLVAPTTCVFAVDSTNIFITLRKI